jgi:hypothetical protein
LALGQLDPTRSEEITDAILTRLAVHICGVVGSIVKKRALGASLLVPVGQELVERLLPGRRVHRARGRQHAVEVE